MAGYNFHNALIFAPVIYLSTYDDLIFLVGSLKFHLDDVPHSAVPPQR